MKGPPAAPKPIPAQDAAESRLLNAVNIKRTENGASLTFQFEGGPLSMAFATPGLARFRYMLETQTDRAGWDAAAAMERMQAEAAAGAAVRRAST
jgi:hypothetical protein